MFYEIRRKSDGLYLHSNGQAVSEYTGQIGDGSKPVGWVKGSGNGLGVSDLELANAIAAHYGAIAVEYK